MRKFLRALRSWVKGLADRALGRMRLAQKLMLIYSVVLGVTIIVFAGQLISVANQSTELAYLKDTQKLLKDSKYDIESKIEICYRVISALSGDYDIMSYLSNWDRDDPAGTFDFSLTLKKKFEQILFLSPDVYQFRVFSSNPNFPEIGSLIYSDRRLLAKKDMLMRELNASPSGYWLVDHAEDNFNTGIIERKNVVSLYTLLRYSSGKNLGITEVAIPTGIFFRHLFSQTENKNLLAFAVLQDGRAVYDAGSGFVNRYKLDRTGLERLCGGLDIREKSGAAPVSVGGIRMHMVYDYVEGIGCSICYVVTNESITRNLENTTVLIILESCVSMIALSLLIYALTRIVFKKMKKVIATMRKVEEGRFDVRAEIAGQDEMSEMAYHFNRMLDKLGDLVTEAVKKQEAKKNAEIRALFAQINSHFIINILEDIRMMAEVDCKYEVADAVISLGKLLRYSLKWSSESAELREEIEYIRSYIDLVNIRYDFKVVLAVEIPLELMEYKVPRVSLQPIVENAVHRGLLPLKRDGLLTVRGRVEGGFTLIEIVDNGRGMDAGRLAAVRRGMESEETLVPQGMEGHGIGLKNVHERIKLVYGAQYGLEIESEENEFTLVRIRLPREN